jgi:hypothetical protein
MLVKPKTARRQADVDAISAAVHDRHLDATGGPGEPHGDPGSPPRVLGHVREDLLHDAVQHQSGVGIQRTVAVDLQRDGDAQRSGGVRGQAREAGRPGGSSSRSIARARSVEHPDARQFVSARDLTHEIGARGGGDGRQPGGLHLHGPEGKAVVQGVMQVTGQPRALSQRRCSLPGLTRGRLLDQQRLSLAAHIEADGRGR